MPFKIRVNSLLLTIFPSNLTAPADVILDQAWAQKALVLNPSGAFPLTPFSIRSREGRRADLVLLFSAAGRFGTPEDLAGAILFLCSRAGAYVSGSSVTLDGGELLVSADGTTEKVESS